MSVQFQTLRDKLRALGCELQCSQQVAAGSESHFEIWIVYRNGFSPTRILVIDTKSDGYALFLDSNRIDIDGDVEAIIEACKE